MTRLPPRSRRSSRRSSRSRSVSLGPLQRLLHPLRQLPPPALYGQTSTRHPSHPWLQPLL